MSGGPLTVAAWAREQRAARGLSVQEDNLLMKLASYANGRGETHVSVTTLARLSGYSRQHTYRLLSRLEELGLVSEPSRRGRGAVRALRVDAPAPGQLGLGDVSHPREVTDPDPGCHISDVTSVTSLGGEQKSQREEIAEDARARRDEAVAILKTAPRAYIDPTLVGIENALAMHPDVSGKDAARLVVLRLSDPSYGMAGELNAARELEYALSFLEQRRDRGARNGQRVFTPRRPGPAGAAAGAGAGGDGELKRRLGW